MWERVLLEHQDNSTRRTVYAIQTATNYLGRGRKCVCVCVYMCAHTCFTRKGSTIVVSHEGKCGPAGLACKGFQVAFDKARMLACHLLCRQGSCPATAAYGTPRRLPLLAHRPCSRSRPRTNPPAAYFLPLLVTCPPRPTPRPTPRPPPRTVTVRPCTSLRYQLPGSSAASTDANASCTTRACVVVLKQGPRPCKGCVCSLRAAALSGCPSVFRECVVM